MPGPPTATTMTAEPGLYRLLAWLSPNFPIGAFSYSHGLEATFAGGAVRDAASLQGWIAAILAQGSGRIDADILVEAHRAALAGDIAALDAANRRGLAFRATAELGLESAQQGEAFLATCRAAWPEAFIEAWATPHPSPLPASGARENRAQASRRVLSPRLRGEGQGEGPYPIIAAPEGGVCHSAVFGAVAARGGIALGNALIGYLGAFAGNLVSAGLRLGIIGQTGGQRILAALEPVVANAAAAALARDAADFGAATFAADLASMAHETQHVRLFRS
jgi:urease accessory protein